MRAQENISRGLGWEESLVRHKRERDSPIAQDVRIGKARAEQEPSIFLPHPIILHRAAGPFEHEQTKPMI
jgi:hypothetical protein